MAKIEPWEERIRGEMAEFAGQLNRAPDLAFFWHQTAHAKDPEHVPELAWGDPKYIDRLVKPAQQLHLVSLMAKVAIQCEEEENEKLRHKAMVPIAQFTDGMKVTMTWELSAEGQYHLHKTLESPEETHPLAVAYHVFALDAYLNRYRDIVHLGVCRVCGTVYVKPKHGQKMRYCSNSCRQKAYRKRQEKGGAKETQG